MEFEITGGPMIDFTDHPRELTPRELDQLRDAPNRIGMIKLYRSLTNATLKAAIYFVDALRSQG